MTWSTHYWGEKCREKGNNIGVIPDLLRRLGLIEYISRYTSSRKMQMIMPAIFTSKLIYCLHVTGSIWGLTEYGEQELMKMSCPKAIILKLQSCQRTAVSLLSPEQYLNWEIRTATILRQAKILSVHQLIAANIIRIAINAMKFRKPKFIYDMLTEKTVRGRNRNRVVIPRCRLNIATESFYNRAARLINMIPRNIIDENSKMIRKKMIKEWVTANIATHPRS